MAVPKRRLSKHRKRTRRAHHSYKKLELNRCTHCGQVIPPGFDKTKDTKKTADEIYAECKHEFNPTTKICSKCRMEERTEGSRFSFLEVD